jgi:hypothetical protein
MPKHRGLTLKKFVRAIPWDLFERYFAALEWEDQPSGWVFLNHEAMEEFLKRPDNAQAGGVILEDFRCINDICEQGMNLVVRGCQKFSLEFDPDRPRQELAMRLFLDHKDAFEFAWSRYLLYASSSRLSFHEIPSDRVQIGESELAAFREETRRWFADLAKGDVCRVSHFEDAGDTVILVSHGSYIRTIAYWEGDRIALNSFRPASEDILVYEPQTSLLSIKARLEKDRQHYLRAFATCMAGDEGLVEDATRRQIFSLRPLQDGTFNFKGDGPITRIELLKVRLKLHGSGDPIIEVKSGDVLQTFSRDLSGLSLASGELTLARFRFHLRSDGEKPAKVTFEIEPPSRTDLAQRRYADIIERYLVEQGVKLL